MSLAAMAMAKSRAAPVLHSRRASQVTRVAYYTMDGREDSIAIPVGAFAESTFPAPTFTVYEDRMHPWVAVPKDTVHMA